MSDYKLDDLICFQLYQASRTMTRLYKEVLGPLGLTYPQYIVMVLLWERGTMTFGDMSKELQLKTGTLSPLLKRMEKDAWVTRQHSRKDDRIVEISLGKKGVENKAIWAEVPCQVSALLGYDEDTYNGYMDVIKDINGHLHDIEVSPEDGK